MMPGGGIGTATTTAPGNLGRGPWLVLAALVFHVVEELPSFPQWATQHFGTTSTGYFVLSHVPLFAAVLYIVYRASRSMADVMWVWLLMAVQCALAANGIFHLLATLWFREYSPGVVTSVAVYAPVTAYLLPRAAQRLGPRATATACGTGVCVAAMLIASLWLDITFV
jgi:Protein of unknown function with HXXEE motif